jgi:hypothetical protein
MREGFDGGSGSGERRSVPAAQRKRFFGKFSRIIFLEMNSVPAALRERLWFEDIFFGMNSVPVARRKRSVEVIFY